MRPQDRCYQIRKEVASHFSHLNESQLDGLARWVYGAILAKSACQNAVTAELAVQGMGSFGSIRQNLREWLYDGKDRARPSPNQLDVETCFEPFMEWVLSMWKSDELALAIDPTLKGDKVVAIVVSVLYRSSAIPVAWRVLAANQKAEWMRPAAKLLRQIAPAVRPDMKVVVMCDRGLQSPTLWNQIEELGWHYLVRMVKSVTFHPDGGTRDNAARMVRAPGQAWMATGTAFGAKRKRRRVTMIVMWDHGQKERWVLMTDLAPGEVEASWYGLRFWIELGFRGLKGVGLEWDKTRRTDPDRVARHWLVLAVAMLLLLAYGSRAEDAEDQGVSPSNLRAPRAMPSTHRSAFSRQRRTVSLLRRGIGWLRRLLSGGRRLWKGLWLLPEAWPEPSPTLKVKHGLDNWLV